jgi:hypothetical protein
MARRSAVCTVRYVVHYRYPWDDEDDSPSGIGDHMLAWGDAHKDITASTDVEAQLASLSDEFRQPCSGWHFREQRAFPVKIVKHVHEETADGFVRDTELEVPLPRSERCPCGKVYWPVNGEQACHSLTAVGEPAGQ